MAVNHCMITAGGGGGGSAKFSSVIMQRFPERCRDHAMVHRALSALGRAVAVELGDQAVGGDQAVALLDQFGQFVPVLVGVQASPHPALAPHVLRYEEPL